MGGRTEPLERILKLKTAPPKKQPGKNVFRKPPPLTTLLGEQLPRCSQGNRTGRRQKAPTTQLCVEETC